MWRARHRSKRKPVSHGHHLQLQAAQVMAEKLREKEWGGRFFRLELA